mgnify:CR=1 FL=1
MDKFIKAKFKSVCAETGNKINKGDSILFDTATHEVFCSTSKRYKSEHERVSTMSYVQAQEDAYFDNFCQRNGI